METELLKHLKTKALQAEAEARGAYYAYKEELLCVAMDAVKKTGLTRGDKIIAHYSNGDVVYIFDGVEKRYDYYATDDEKFNKSDQMWRNVGRTPYLIGRRILKSGKPSKAKCQDEIVPVYLLRLVEKIE